MEKVVLKVDGMTCEHCKKAITKAVGELDGVRIVNVSIVAKTVEVEYEPLRVSLEQIKSEIEEQGYEII